MLAAATFETLTGTLRITATNSAGETLKITKGSRGETLLNGNAIRPNGTTIATSTVSQLVIDGGAGPDVIDLTGVTTSTFSRLNVATPGRIQVFGHDGNDTLIGTALADRLKPSVRQRASASDDMPAAMPCLPSNILRAPVNPSRAI